MNQKHQILEIVSFNVNYLQNTRRNAVSQDFNFELKSIIVWPYRTYSESTVWQQDRDSLPNRYTINHPKTLRTQRNSVTTAAHRWHFVLQDVSCRKSYHVLIPRQSWVPPVWPYYQKAQCQHRRTAQGCVLPVSFPVG